MTYDLSRQDLANDLKERALRELKDGVLSLNYRQIQDLKAERFSAILPVIERQLKRLRRNIVAGGIAVTILVGFSLYMELRFVGPAGVSAGYLIHGLVVNSLWLLFFVVEAFKWAFPTMARLESARTLLQVYVEWTLPTPSVAHGHKSIMESEAA